MLASHVVRFGVFELDTRSGELRRHGLKVRLPDQSFQILNLLLSRPGEVVTREELRNAVWTAQTFVDFEAGLNSAVRKLRDALDDSADNPRFVETLPRRGYRFVASVSVPASPSVEVEPVVDLATVPARVVQPSPLVPTPSPITTLAPMPGPARGRRRLTRNAALVLGVLIAATAATAFQWWRSSGVAARPAPMGSLVVLPFENLTGDPAQDAFAATVTDAVTAHLAQVEGIDVISRTSARQFSTIDKPLKVIAAELAVNGVVIGTVARSGSAVDITVHLIRGATERDVWTRTYHGDLSRLMGLQQRIASDIAVAAGGTASPVRGTATTQVIDPQAYSAYLKGLTAQGQQQFEGFRRAVAYYEEAVGIQPDFAEAHAALAVAQMQFLFGGPISPHEAVPKAEAAARRALQLDEAMPRAHQALGQILLLYHWRHEEGDRALERAAQLQGKAYNDATGARSAALRRAGRFAEALAVAERGRKLDPLSVEAQIAVGTAYRAAGQHDRAIHELRQAIEMSPARPRVHYQLGVTFVLLGRFTDAIGALEIAARPTPGHNTRVEAHLGYAYAASGRTADARRVLTELEAHRREQYVSFFGTALIHDALGEKEPALAALRRAYDDHAVEFGLIDQYPGFKTIASEPAFQTVMRQVGR